ncbi:MAG: hypothetical protein NXI31_05985 [bacterium]|nr:hypothetical protein [bacterium]
MADFEWLRFQPTFDEGVGAHFVDGRAVRDGDALQLRVRDGHWARVIYLRKSHTRRGANTQSAARRRFGCDDDPASVHAASLARYLGRGMTRAPFAIEFSEDRTTVRINGTAFADEAPVRIRIGDEWFDGELQLWRSAPTVFAPAFGHVHLRDAAHSTCIVDALAPALGAGSLDMVEMEGR